MLITTVIFLNETSVIERAIKLHRNWGILSNFMQFGHKPTNVSKIMEPFKITATQFETQDVNPVDIHTMDDLLEVHRIMKNEFSWDKLKKN